MATRPTQDEPASERRADAPAPYQGFDGPCMNGSWRPGRHGGVQIGMDPYSDATLTETIMANQRDLEVAPRFAPRRQAKSYGLRAVTNLARLSGEEGRRAEALSLLAPFYGWFTEGFDTADLKDAKALLDQLA